jgi:2-hydroxychromene-2-carboxylate isomerase
MAEQFKEQGGVATMDPSPFYRWATSKVMTHLSRPDRLQRRREKFESRRAKTGAPHRLEYFHQVSDGYSHLAAQVLPSLVERYDIELHCHLVNGPRGDNLPEPELLLKLSRYDSAHVAPEYGLEFPPHDEAPRASSIDLATAILAAQSDEDFAARAAEVGRALWSDDEAILQDLATRYGKAAPGETRARVEAGSRRQRELRHYSGAMFYYGEEWYWGVDRLYHLEKRLAALGADRQPGQPMLVPRPPLEVGELRTTAA